MLDISQRADRYLAQTGRTSLTPRQRRRLSHKIGHQSYAATVRRQTRSIARAKARKAAQERHTALLPASR
jgi:hypothetical protein